jgi:hypothetical protein
MVDEMGKSKATACQFVDDTKTGTDKYWCCVVHHVRVSDPLRPCFFSRYDGAPFEICSGWKEQGCPTFAHCHATVKGWQGK